MFNTSLVYVEQGPNIMQIKGSKMQLNKPLTPLKELHNKFLTLPIIIVMIALIILSNGYCFSQSNNSGKTMKTTKKAATVYLDKKDPKFISIKSRVFYDLDEIVKQFDPESEKNKLIDIQTKTWTEEMRNESQVLGAQSISNYAEQTHFDAGMFMMILTTIGGYDQKKLEKEWEVRVQSAGADKYIAEFWEDGLIVNSEENALVYAHELAVSEYAKKHPDSDVGNVEIIKKNYANTRKSINAGKQERYTKMIALLYDIDNEGRVTFIDPFQPAIDFLKNNSK